MAEKKIDSMVTEPATPPLDVAALVDPRTGVTSVDTSGSQVSPGSSTGTFKMLNGLTVVTN